MAAKKPATISSAKLAAATQASIKALLGRPRTADRGSLAGFWLDKKKIPAGREPLDIATEIASSTSIAVGQKLQPGVMQTARGILVGYLRP